MGGGRAEGGRVGGAVEGDGCGEGMSRGGHGMLDCGERVAAEAVARYKAVLAAAETVVEEAEMEQVVGLPSKQKGWAEGGRRASRTTA